MSILDKLEGKNIAVSKDEEKFIKIFHKHSFEGFASVGLLSNHDLDRERTTRAFPLKPDYDFNVVLENISETDKVYVLDCLTKEEIAQIYQKVEFIEVINRQEEESLVLTLLKKYFPFLVGKTPDAIPMPVGLVNAYVLGDRENNLISWDWVLAFYFFGKSIGNDYLTWYQIMGKVEIDQDILTEIKTNYLKLKASIDEIINSSSFIKVENEIKYVLYPSVDHFNITSDIIAHEKVKDQDFIFSYMIRSNSNEDGTTTPIDIQLRYRLVNQDYKDIFEKLQSLENKEIKTPVPNVGNIVIPYNEDKDINFYIQETIEGLLN